MAKSEARLAYLRSTLELDPANQAGRILELRRAHRNSRPESGAPRTPDHVHAQRVQRTRESAERLLIAAGRAFWDEDFDADDALSPLGSEDFPDLARLHQRLRRVAGHRDQVLAAGELNGVDPNFFEALCLILVAPEAERVEHRRLTLSAMGARRLRLLGQRSAKALHRHAPEVYALEKPWLDDVRHAKRYLREAGPVGGTLGCFGAYLIFRLARFLYTWLVD